MRDGFEWIMQGNIDHVMPLTIDGVSRIHFLGGSHIGISRANPTRDPQHLENTVISLLRLNVSQLLTIGGDDTAFSAMKLEEKAGGRIRVVHVPKTIDNDLDLPPYVDTFGFQTARHYGVEIVKNLMVDAQTTSRWYFVIAMGRKAGHLALGIGKAAGATLTLIPEEFEGQQIRLKVDRGHAGRRHHQAPQLRPPRRRRDHRRGPRPRHRPGGPGRTLEDVERDAHGNVRIAEVNIGDDPQGPGEPPPQAVRHQGDDRAEEHRLRAAVRGSDPVRHGVHARPRVLRGEVPAVGRQRRDDLDAGRPLRADPVQRADRREDRPDEDPAGGHPLDAVRDRPAVHAPAAARRLRGPARAGEVRGDGGDQPAGVPDEFEPLVANEPPPFQFDVPIQVAPEPHDGIGTKKIKGKS